MDAEAAAAAFLAESGLGNDGGSGGAAEKKKKKKKAAKKTGAGASAAGEGGGAGAAAGGGGGAVKQTAKGKAIAERQAKLKEEEDRIRREQEEEEAKLRAEEEAEAAKAKEIEEEKERKRIAKKEKLDKKKKEGTYKTKKQKEQEARAQAAVEAMKAAGIEVPTGDDSQTKKRPMYGGKKKKKTKEERLAEKEGKPAAGSEEEKHNGIEAEAGAVAEQPPAKEEEEEEEEEGEEEQKEEEKPALPEPPAMEDWEDAAADDWDTADVTDIIGKIQVKEEGFDDEVDLIEKEKADEQERLRLAGIERRKLEERRRIEEEKHKAEEEERQREILAVEMAKEEARRRRLARETEAMEARSPDVLRSPIVCIMGHVDTGKTKLLDKIRQTNVQEGEAGGITQQIGATFFAKDTLLEKMTSVTKDTENMDAIATLMCGEKKAFNMQLPGMLIIDTPGHEAFTNLRSRGSNLCDMAILVIDLMHGLEPQTVESLNLLRSKRTPFVVALNKVDRCYGWKATPNGPMRESLAMQDQSTRDEFHDRTVKIRTELMEKGLNAELYWENEDPASTVSLVPTSAITGEGVPDILMWLVQLTQERLCKKLMFMPSFLQCTVLEVKVIEGLGTTVDLIIVNGKLREGDTIVACTLDGPVVSTIRACLTPPPGREMRVKADYIHHKEISGAMGVKICANGIENVVAGTPIMVVGPDDDESDIKEEVMKDMTMVMKLDVEKTGVLVQASTLGALEALMQFLRKECDPPIPVSGVGIGPIFRRDVMRAGIMAEKGHPEYATILAFDVRIDSDASTYANENNVRIFTADIIYHLFDQFTAYMDGLMEGRRADAVNTAVFPCIAKALPEFVFNKQDPIIMGMEVIEGTLRVGTPLCIPKLDGLEIGRVASIEVNSKPTDKLAKGAQGAVRIEDAKGGSTLCFGKQFDDKSGAIYSSITRASIDALKLNFRSQVTQDDMRLLVQLKKVFNIP